LAAQKRNKSSFFIKRKKHEIQIINK
jgi:hypothetical protein